MVLQAAEIPHIKGAACMVHRSRRQEQPRLEKRVREEMEYRRAVRTDAQRKHHVTQLADSRVCQYPFDVVRHQRHRCREHSGYRANNRAD